MRRTDSFRSPWIAAEAGVDQIRLARLLAKAHRFAISRGRAPAVLRSVVACSWQRAAAEGVDPDGCAPAVLDSVETTRALARHPASRLLPVVTKMLGEATSDTKCFATLSDADGVLLWIDGSSKAIDGAVAPGFLPGHLCSEGALGTNAVGTALAIGHPVQIFAAEHFNRRLHGLTCAAAPIRDRESGSVVGSLNLSGSFRTNHPHSLSLVAAVAGMVEEALGRELERRDDELRARYIDLLGSGIRGRSALVTASGRVLAASPRGWLGSRIRVGSDGRPLPPAGIEADAERIDPAGEAFLLRTSRRAPADRIPAIAIEPLGSDRVRLSIAESRLDLSRRHSQLLALLVIHPAGLSAEELRRRAYPASATRVTVRAEMSRLRRLLGPVLRSNPYRLEARLSADREAMRRLLPPCNPRRRRDGASAQG